jgi:hypothetical protein
MSKIIGIDLGTTNSLVAIVDSGIPIVLADTQGNRLTPSVVHVPGLGKTPVIGEKANRVRVVKPAETVYSVKRFMGRRGGEIGLIVRRPQALQPRRRRETGFGFPVFRFGDQDSWRRIRHAAANVALTAARCGSYSSSHVQPHTWSPS